MEHTFIFGHWCLHNTVTPFDTDYWATVKSHHNLAFALTPFVNMADYEMCCNDTGLLLPKIIYEPWSELNTHQLWSIMINFNWNEQPAISRADKKSIFWNSWYKALFKYSYTEQQFKDVMFG